MQNPSLTEAEHSRNLKPQSTARNTGGGAWVSAKKAVKEHYCASQKKLAK